MTPAELRACMPHSGARAETFATPLTQAMEAHGITTTLRQAAFLSQVCHESGSLRYTRELADGKGYEGRADLGNTQPGDGPRYKGRGLLQITGRANYAACGIALGLDLLAHPELLEAPEGASRSAGWFWHSRNLNGLADAQKFWTISKIINGGTNGLDDRIEHYVRIRKVLGS